MRSDEDSTGADGRPVQGAPDRQDDSENRGAAKRDDAAGIAANPELQDNPDWSVSIEPDPSGEVASVVLSLSKNGRTFRHRLDAQAATQLSNALIVEAERARFRAAYRKPN
jgi:hypothetical protein